MLINQELSQEIYDDAGETRATKAKRYVREGRVTIIKSDYESENDFSLTSIVSGNYDEYRVTIDVKKGELEIAECECKDYLNYYGVCKHILATFMKFEQTKYWDNSETARQSVLETKKINNSFKYKSFNNLISTFYNDEINQISPDETIVLPENEKIKIEPKINFDKFSSAMKLEIKIGKSRMYKIKDLPEFYTRMCSQEYFKYGEKLELVHKKENFEENSKELLDFILKYASIMKYTTNSEKYGYYYTPSVNKSEIILGESIIDEAFEILKKHKVNFNYNSMNMKLEILEENPNVKFNLSKINKDELTLKPNIDVFKIAIFERRKI